MIRRIIWKMPNWVHHRIWVLTGWVLMAWADEQGSFVHPARLKWKKLVGGQYQ